MENLFESRLFRSSSSLSNKSAEDIKNIVSLHFMTLSILKEEFSTAAWAQNYITQTFKKGAKFTNVNTSDTDLAWALHILITKDTSKLNQKFQEENEVEFDRIHIPDQLMVKWVKQSVKGTASNNLNFTFLTTMAKTLRVNSGDYKNIAIAAGQWTDMTDAEKSVICTRLLFALEKHMRMSEIYPVFKDFAKSKKYIIKNANNPENPNEIKVGTLMKQAANGVIAGILTTMVAGKLLGRESQDSYRQRIQSYFKDKP